MIPNIKEITNQNILEIDIQRIIFNEKYESTQQSLSTYNDLASKIEKNIEDLEIELKKIEEVYQESDSDAKEIIKKQFRYLRKS